MPSHPALFPSALCCLLTVPLLGQSLDYKRVMADELVRNCLLVGTLEDSSGVAAGQLTTPSSLNGRETDHRFLRASYHYTFEPMDSEIGQVRARIRGNIGYSDYAENIPPPTPGQASDRDEGMAFGVNVHAEVRLRPWNNTLLHARVGYGYLYSDNDYTARNPSSQALAPFLDGSTRNWFANAATSVTQFGLAQDLPLWPGSWEESAESPTRPRLRVFTRFTSASVLGLWGETNDQQRHLTAYLWTSGASLHLPLATHDSLHFFAQPFFQVTAMHNDAGQSISSKGHFYEAGLRLGVRKESEFWSGTDAIFLSGSAFWGGETSGWQTALAFQF